MHGEDIRISELDYKQQVRGTLLLLWNVYNFFVTYATVDSWKPGTEVSKNVMDRWIMSRMNGNIKKMVDNGYEKYDAPVIVGESWNFMQDLSTWYVRRSRTRKTPEMYQTLWTVLTTYCRALAPLIPFVTEEMLSEFND